jgi:hypothetical protein
MVSANFLASSSVAMRTVTLLAGHPYFRLCTVSVWRQSWNGKWTVRWRDFHTMKRDVEFDSIAESARSATAMRDVADALMAQSKAVNANLRAYVTLGLLGVVPQNKDTGYRYEVRMNLQNVGNTPANKLAFILQTDLLPLPLPPDFTIPAFDQLPAAGTSTVGPHQNSVATAVAPRIYSDEEVDEMKHGNKKLLYVFGTVTYEDIFGESHYTKICQIILWMADGTTATTRNYGNYNASN